MITFWDKFGNAVNGLMGWKGKDWQQYSTYFQLGQKGAVWMDVNKPYWVYETIPQIKTVIDRKALMFSNMDLQLCKVEGDEQIENPDYEKLIQNPNLMQGMNEWLMQYKQQEQIYGNTFLYKNKPSALTDFPIALWNVSPRYVQPVLTGKVFDQIAMSGIVEHYDYQDGGVTRKFEVDSILWGRLGHVDNPLIGQSPIFALKFPITNTEKAYEYRNVIMSEKGAIGILSNQTKDAMGGIPLKQEERERIEKEYRSKYGVGEDQAKIMITNAAMSWQPMSYPTKDMLLFEEVDANLLTIVDAFGLNINIFSSKNATFENVKAAILQCYEDTIQPEADKFAQSLGKFIGIPEGTKLCASYAHLNLFKENKEKGANALVSMLNWLTNAINNKLISIQQAQIILGNELDMPLDAVKAVTTVNS